MQISTLTDETRLALATLAERATGIATPSLRLGVTGLARAGKTVFISAMVHNLIHGGRLPLFRAYSSGRVFGARLAPQPDDAVPRFDYERHVSTLVEERLWPDSTRRISELRLTLQYEPEAFVQRRLGRDKLHVDIVDYPGEWLLDLPLLSKDYATWSAEAVEAARMPSRSDVAYSWLSQAAAVDPDAAEDEDIARRLAGAYTDYLRGMRKKGTALSTQAPGRFLMPGDLDGSPALTFSPLILENATLRSGTLGAMMARRYESYKSAVVRPFFRDHFARLDSQIVLVDALEAIDAGPSALAALETGLADILSAFRLGRTNWVTGLVTRRIDKILFAATKADHLNHRDHDRLEAILARLVSRAVERARFAGARVEVIALASVRATREGTVNHLGEKLPSIIGTPLPGEVVDGRTFNGESEIALFPGDLPQNPESVFEPGGTEAPAVRFVRFRPPKLERTAEGQFLSLPHIRLDRALQFLIGDALK